MAAIAALSLAACSSAVPTVTVSISANPSTSAANPAHKVEAKVTAVASTKAALDPGEYCYETKTDSLDAIIRLTIAANGQVTGDGSATIQDEANSYYSSYTQVLSGSLNGDELALDVGTQIEGDVQNANETWTLDGDRLTNGRQTFSLVECAAVNNRFADTTVTEAEDLELASTNASRKRVEFAPDTSSTVASHAVLRGDRDVYLLGAAAGQVMVLSITALENNAVFDVAAPNGKVLGQASTEQEVRLPNAGDYQVIVGGTRGNASYDLTIAIR